MRRTRREQLEQPKPDLTPMIDIVFNLIVFFLVVSELSNLQVEPISLAKADQAQPPPERGAGITLNVLEDGAVSLRGASYMRSDPRLGAALEIEALGHPREPSQAGEPPPSTLRVNLRVDREARFGAVQEVLERCIDQGLYKTTFAADPSR